MPDPKKPDIQTPFATLIVIIDIKETLELARDFVGDHIFIDLSEQVLIIVRLDDTLNIAVNGLLKKVHKFHGSTSKEMILIKIKGAIIPVIGQDAKEVEGGTTLDRVSILAGKEHDCGKSPWPHLASCLAPRESG